MISFRGNTSVKMSFEKNGTASLDMELSVADAIEVIHELCDDIDLVGADNLDELREAADRLHYLLEEEDD